MLEYLFQNILFLTCNFQIYIIIWRDVLKLLPNVVKLLCKLLSHSYSQSKWVLTRASKEATTNGNQMLKRVLGSWFFHIQFMSSIGYIGLLFVIYAPPPFFKAPLKLCYVWEVLAFSIWILLSFDSQQTSNFVQVLSL